MPILDAAAVENLQKVCQEVALRAERLDELLSLGYQLRALDVSYSNVSGEAKAHFTTDQNNDWGRLSDLWANCRDNDLAEFRNFIQSVKKIRESLPTESIGGLGQEIDSWSKELTMLADKFQKVLDANSRPEVNKFYPPFQTAVKNQIMRHKLIVTREAKELCVCTEKLKDKLAA